MGDCVSPRKQEVVDRLRQRFEKCRQQNNLSYQRFTAVLPARLQTDNQETRALFQRYQDSKNKRPAKNVKQEDKQNKVRNDTSEEKGNSCNDADTGRQHLMQFLDSRKRSHATSSPKASSEQLGQGSHHNGYGDSPRKRPCTSTEVKVQINTPDHQTKVVVQTTFKSTVDMGKDGVSHDITTDPDSFNNIMSQGGNFDDIGKLLEGMDNEKELDDLLATVVGNPNDVAAFEARLAKVEEETRKMLNEEFGEGIMNMPKSQQQQLQLQQLQQQQDINPGNAGHCSQDAQAEKVDIKPKIEPSRDSYDPNMKAPPNTVATEAAGNKKAPLPGINNLIGNSRDNYGLQLSRVKLEKEALVGSNRHTSIPNSCAPNYQPLNQSVPSSMLASMGSNVPTLGRPNNITVTSVQSNQVRSYPTPVGMTAQDYGMQNVGTQQALSAVESNSSMPQFPNQTTPGRLPGFVTFQSQVAGGAHQMQQFKREQTSFSQDNPLLGQQQNMPLPMQQFGHPQQQQQQQQQPQQHQQQQQHVQITQQQLRHKMQQQLRQQRIKQLTAEQQLVLRRQLQQQRQRGPPPRYSEQHRTFASTGMMSQQQPAGNLMHRTISGPNMMSQTMQNSDPSHQVLQQGGNMLPMRGNHLMANTQNQVQSPMYQNQAQVQFLQQQQQRRQLMQSMNVISNSQQQTINPMAMNRGQHPNATMGPSGPFMKQVRSQNHANMWPNQMHSRSHDTVVGGNPRGASGMSQTIRQPISNMVRFPGGANFQNQAVNTTANMQNYQNVSSQANMRASSAHTVLNHQQPPQGYCAAQQLRPQGNATQLSQTQPTISVNIQQSTPAAAAVSGSAGGGGGSQQYGSNHLPLDNLLDNNMPNSSLGTSDMFDLDLLENILKNKD